MTQTHLAASADYADALLTARKVKSLVTGVLLFVLMAELTLFFCLRYRWPLTTPASDTQLHFQQVMQYLVGLLDFAGLILPVILSVTLLILLQVQLVGRLLGTGRMTSAFLWSVLLAILLFPWQAVLNNPVIHSDPLSSELGMKVPGVIYTWAEISNPAEGASFGMDQTKPDLAAQCLHWARYAGFPLLSVLIIATIHSKTRRSLRQALGEDQIVVATKPLV